MEMSPSPPLDSPYYHKVPTLQILSCQGMGGKEWLDPYNTWRSQRPHLQTHTNDRGLTIQTHLTWYLRVHGLQVPLHHPSTGYRNAASLNGGQHRSCIFWVLSSSEEPYSPPSSLDTIFLTSWSTQVFGNGPESDSPPFLNYLRHQFSKTYLETYFSARSPLSGITAAPTEIKHHKPFISRFHL